MLPLALGYLGFASSPASITGTACGDIPDSVMVGLTGGRADEEINKLLMERNQCRNEEKRDLHNCEAEKDYAEENYYQEKAKREECEARLPGGGL